MLNVVWKAMIGFLLLCSLLLQDMKLQDYYKNIIMTKHILSNEEKEK